MKKRAIRLYYHGGCSNHGCEAIVRGTAKILNTDLILFSKAPDLDKAYGIEKLLDLREDAAVSLPKRSIKRISAAVHHKLTHTDYQYIRYAHDAFFSQVHHGDVCLSIGGDNYCYAGTDILGYYNQIIHKRGGKTVLWGCSVEPKGITSALATDLSRYDLIVARESLSYEALRKVNPNTVLLPDPAFQLDKIELTLPEGFAEGNTVGINVSPLIMNCEAHSGITASNYLRLVEHILRTTDMNVALIPHVVEPGNDDREPLRILFEKFKDTNRVAWIDDHNCMELKGFISRCRFFVGARTHATIAAYSTCVPTLVVGYSVKARGIAKDIFGTDENYVLPVQSLANEDDLTKAFSWMQKNEDAIRSHLQATMPEYRSRALQAGEYVRKLVK